MYIAYIRIAIRTGYLWRQPLSHHPRPSTFWSPLGGQLAGPHPSDSTIPLGSARSGPVSPTILSTITVNPTYHMAPYSLWAVLFSMGIDRRMLASRGRPGIGKRMRLSPCSLSALGISEMREPLNSRQLFFSFPFLVSGEPLV